MSDPYNQYSYGSPAPGSGYPPPAGYSAQGGSPYPQQGGYAPPQHQQSWGLQQPGYDYSSQQGYQQQQQQQGYGAYGPPAHGGFQNGQQPPAQWNQTGYNDPNAAHQPQQVSHQFPQQGAYNSSLYPSDPNVPPQQPGHYSSTDPNLAQEGDRGLLGAVGGGIAGHMGGKKYGHGLIGTVAGAIAGSKLEDKFKSKNKHGHGQQQQGHSSGKFW